MNIEKTQNLVNQVTSLLKNYEKLTKLTGENFNIFTVMGMESNEVKTHSAIIGELLNPQGSHGLGTKPLKLFVEQITSKLGDVNISTSKKFQINFESAKSLVEEHIGFTSEDKIEGGRIDIVIQDKDRKSIIIENKIYAGEQENQLKRYNNWDKNAPILYLTLFGDKPKSAAGLIENLDYFIISYESHILLWLKECVKEAVKFPMLREVINQYINLIKKLTHQTINYDLKMEISELIKNNFLEAAEIANNFEAVKNEIIQDFFSDFANAFNQLKDNEDWELYINADNNNQYFIKKKNWNNVALAIWKKDVIYYGVKLIRATSNNKIPKIEVGSYKTSPNSILWNNKFVIRVNTAQDIMELINDKEQKIKSVLEFVKVMKDDLESHCEDIEKNLNNSK